MNLIEIELTDEQLKNVSGGFFRHESRWEEEKREREEREERERQRRHHHGHWGWHHHWVWDR
jgi:bacteriocin-like protein